MKRGRAVCSALFAAAALLYLSYPSAYYNFDGVACAIAVDLGDLKNLAHGNHVAYGLVGLAFARLWRLFGYEGPAILALNGLNALLGAATAAVFCSTLLRLKFKERTALLCSAGLVVSQAFWFGSLEAQVYPLGAFFLALAAREALSGKPRPVRLGLLQGAAALGHVGHLMFFPAALYLLRRAKARRADYFGYAASFAVVVALAYALAAAICIRPQTFDELRLWLLGSAALKVDRSFTWYGGWSVADLVEWARMSGRIFCDPGFASGWTRDVGLGLALAALAAVVAGAVFGRDRKLVAASLLWIGGYALLFASWEPFTVVYRYSDLLAFWLLIALAAERIKGITAVAALSLWLVGASLFNVSTNIKPRADGANNKPYQEALWLEQNTPEDAWIVATGMGQVYIPYFGHRKPLNMRYWEGKMNELPARLDALAGNGNPPYITSTTLAAEPWLADFQRYGLKETARRGDVVLYRLTRTGSRGAKAGKS